MYFPPNSFRVYYKIGVFLVSIIVSDVSSDCGSIGSEGYLAKKLVKRGSTVGRSVTVKLSPSHHLQQPVHIS